LQKGFDWEDKPGGFKDGSAGGDKAIRQRRSESNLKPRSGECPGMPILKIPQ
jgi:hypothetical protein